MGYVKEIRKKIGNDPLFMPCAGVILYENNKVLLQKRTDFNLWGIHGGSMELGETFLDVATRELKEETGLTVTQIKPFKLYTGKDQVIHYPNGDVSYLINQIYLATKTIGELKKQDSEVLELKWFPINELPWDEMMSIDTIVLQDFIKIINN